MDTLRGFAVLLLCQSAGELLARGAALHLPGPVLGMLMLLALLSIAAVRAPVAAAADALLSHLSLLFVPVGVGVIAHLGLVADYGVRLIVVVAISTWLGMAVTALMLRKLWHAGERSP
ncbi:MAG TPA: CidA/LrgA family protein [Burkholderiaceae bacterium]|nr:CidA/LrgA family protein [Burkholderiaceae bacterium]